VKAAVFHASGRPLEITEVPTPEPAAGEALIRVAGCGMCHTDLHYLDHGVKPFKTPPLILGHEVAGVVEAVGQGVTGRAPGDRVLIPAVLSCGRCGYCRQGRENLCDRLVMLGNNIDGGYAEFVVVPAGDLITVPPDVTLEHACVIADGAVGCGPGSGSRWWVVAAWDSTWCSARLWRAARWWRWISTMTVWRWRDGWARRTP
jgi:propanol-preferring alcohol dehydrogenase